MCELACTRWQGNGNIVQREGYFFLRFSAVTTQRSLRSSTGSYQVMDLQLI